MIDPYTLEQCKQNKEILQLKIRNLEYAIKQSEEMIVESKMDASDLIFLKRKMAASIQELEALYLLMNKHETNKAL